MESKMIKLIKEQEAVVNQLAELILYYQFNLLVVDELNKAYEDMMHVLIALKKIEKSLV
jgi:hypothetical protein